MTIFFVPKTNFLNILPYSLLFYILRRDRVFFQSTLLSRIAMEKVGHILEGGMPLGQLCVRLQWQGHQHQFLPDSPRAEPAFLIHGMLIGCFIVYAKARFCQTGLIIFGRTKDNSFFCFRDIVPIFRTIVPI